MRVALDTDVLAYAEAMDDSERLARATDVIQALSTSTTVVPVQVLGELFRVLIRKGRRSSAEARAAVLAWRDVLTVHETSEAAFVAAMDLATDHSLQIWDAIIMAAAAEAGCRLLLSEDLQSGFTWQGLTVVDPFATEPHPLLGAALNRRP